MMFFEYIWLAWYGTSAGGFDGPMIVTPLCTTISSGRVSSQLPPRSAARSTTTDPGCIASTISVVMRIGARFPGMSAVVITTSLRGDDFDHHLALAPVERLVLRLGVAALVFRVGGFERQLDESGAEALHLLLDRGPHVVGLDLGAEPARRRDRLKSRDAGADDEHARRRDGPGGRHQHRKHARQVVGGEQHALVAGDGRHRRQRVHALRARDPWHQLHRQHRRRRWPPRREWPAARRADRRTR